MSSPQNGNNPQKLRITCCNYIPLYGSDFSAFLSHLHLTQKTTSFPQARSVQGYIAYHFPTETHNPVWYIRVEQKHYPKILLDIFFGYLFSTHSCQLIQFIDLSFKIIKCDLRKSLAWFFFSRFCKSSSQGQYSIGSHTDCFSQQHRLIELERKNIRIIWPNPASQCGTGIWQRLLNS